VISTLDEPVFTTEIVFAEACHLLKHERAALLALIRQVAEKRLNLESVRATRASLSEQHPKAKIVTLDIRDFTVYRRFRDETLPLIHL